MKKSIPSLLLAFFLVSCIQFGLTATVTTIASPGFTASAPTITLTKTKTRLPSQTFHFYKKNPCSSPNTPYAPRRGPAHHPHQPSHA
jgi:hypothetical protein